eukprot:2612272-Pyramimonas_sp.AAC.1
MPRLEEIRPVGPPTGGQPLQGSAEEAPLHMDYESGQMALGSLMMMLQCRRNRDMRETGVSSR